MTGSWTARRSSAGRRLGAARTRLAFPQALLLSLLHVAPVLGPAPALRWGAAPSAHSHSCHQRTRTACAVPPVPQVRPDDG
jgi:hypothetical protein